MTPTLVTIQHPGSYNQHNVFTAGACQQEVIDLDLPASRRSFAASARRALLAGCKVTTELAKGRRLELWLAAQQGES